MNLRYTLSFFRIMKTPGLYPIMKDWMACIRMNFIFAAYESGLLQALIQPCNRNTLIERLHVERTELLDALLEVGLATKELTIHDEQYSIKGKRSKTVSGADGDMLAAMIQANMTYYSDAYRNATSRMRGAELGQELDEIGDIVARFSKFTEPIIKNLLSSIVHAKNPIAVLDVGCGSGFLLRSAYEINNNAKGIGLDIDPAVVDQAKANMASWGLADRFNIQHGNILDFKTDSGPFNLISLLNILYYFDLDERLRLVKKLREMLSSDGKLAVVMSFRSKGKDIGTANLNMVNSSLKGLTPLPYLEEIKSLLKQCGFRKIKVHRFMPGSTFYGMVASIA
jgi:SAM-dependent methyltransferase